MIRIRSRWYDHFARRSCPGVAGPRYDRIDGIINIATAVSDVAGAADSGGGKVAAFDQHHQIEDRPASSQLTHHLGLA